MLWIKRKKTEKCIYSSEAINDALMILKTRADIAQHTVDYICKNLIDQKCYVFDTLRFDQVKSPADNLEIFYVIEDNDKYFESKDFTLFLKIIAKAGYQSYNSNRIEFSINNKTGKLRIDEIVTISTNCGYGTKMMERLLEYAQIKNVQRITGMLSKTDIEDHGDRLLHFYTKFGFEILYNNEGIPKGIKKILNET